MAKRALDSWGPEAEKNEETWCLLSDAYALLGDDRQGRTLPALAREARARERAASGRPLTPDEQLEEAIERRDLAAVEARLHRLRPLALAAHAGGGPARAGAGLGRLGACWRRPGMTDDKRLIASEDAAALVSDVRDLREQLPVGRLGLGQRRSARPARGAQRRRALRAARAGPCCSGWRLGAAELWALPPTTSC